MQMTKNAVEWFEIPVTDFARAKQFYSAIFDFSMPEMPMGCIPQNESGDTTARGRAGA